MRDSVIPSVVEFSTLSDGLAITAKAEGDERITHARVAAGLR